MIDPIYHNRPLPPDVLADAHHDTVHCGPTHHNACNCREAYFAALRAEVERLKVAEGEAMLVVESQDASIAALKAELAKYTEPLTYEQAAIVCNDYRLGVLTEGDVDEIDAAIRRVRGER